MHPGHIVGPGWRPVGPLGNLDPAVWHTLSAGQPLAIPGIGTEFLHHVHADDVAQAFEAAIDHRDGAAGEDFDIVAPTAVNVRGFAQLAAGWFGQAASCGPSAGTSSAATTTDEFADSSWEHLRRNHYVSIDKARRVLGYTPRYEPDDAVLESVRWLVEHDQLELAQPLTA